LRFSGRASRLTALLPQSQPGARQCAPRGPGVGLWGPREGPRGFGAQPRLVEEQMEREIDNLVTQYESRGLTRRQFVASLAAMVGAGSTSVRAAQCFVLTFLKFFSRNVEILVI